MKKVFCDHLRELRGTSSQSDFAAIIGAKQTTYSSWERGVKEPDLDTLCKISTQFGVSSDWLLGLPDRGTSATTITGNSGSIAIGNGAKANYTRSVPDCTHCKYKAFAEVFKAIQTPS